MQTVKVIARFVQILDGFLHLADELVRDRDHALEPLGDNRFRVLAPVGFKRGQVFGYEGPKLDKISFEILNECPTPTGEGDNPDGESDPDKSNGNPIPSPHPVNLPPSGETSVETLMNDLGLNFREVQTLLDDYKIKVAKKSDTIPNDALKPVYEDYMESEDGETGEGDDDETNDEVETA